MATLRQIFEGYHNLATGKKEKIANERYAICKGCHLFKNNFCNPLGVGKVVRDFSVNGRVYKKGQIVRGCGCYLPAKVRSSSYCPLGKW